MKKFDIKISSEEDAKKYYELFDSFKSKKDIFDYYGVSDNKQHNDIIKQVADIIGFDFGVYKERRYPSKFCLQCGKKLSGEQEKFCSKSCAAKYNNKTRVVTAAQKEKTSKTLKEYNERNPREKVLYRYVCENCGETFFTRRKIKDGRHCYCSKCKISLGRKYIKNVDSILELPKRTMIKILKRAQCGCAICGWHEATCDVHHIVPKKDGGTDDNINLIVVCPNHHRILHTNKDLYSYEFLRSLSVENLYPNWKDYYYNKDIE
jgi:hypothetical protein